MTTVKLGDQTNIESLILSGRDDVPGNPAAGEILVRVEASSLNQHDLNVVIGHLPSEPGRVLLTDAAGIVEEIGEDVTEFAVGDRVISCFFPQWQKGQQAIPGFSTTPGDGVDGYARPAVIRPANWFTRAPHHMTSLEAATLPTAALTAWRALFIEGSVKAGDTILVLGTGGVSLFALQFAKAVGARVIATTSSDEKAKRLLDLGADQVVNYVTTPDWGKAVAEATGGGVDLTVEIGGPGTLLQSIFATKIGGTIAMIGVLTGVQGPVPTALLMARQQRLQGIMVGSREQQQGMVKDLENWNLHPIIDSTFEMDSIAEAFRHMQSGKHFGKIAVSV